MTEEKKHKFEELQRKVDEEKAKYKSGKIDLITYYMSLEVLFKCELCYELFGSQMLNTEIE